MEKLTLEEIVKAVDGTLLVKGNITEFDKISTDSREISPNSIFIALNGENFNGNKYAPNAITGGAKLCIVDEEIEIPDNSDCSLIKVKSGKEALLNLAEYYRSKLPIKIIGVTGSTGKTSTKDLIGAALSKRFKVFKTKGNFNNEIGVPLMIFSLDESYEVAVLEMGMNNFGEIHNLAKVARPDIAVLTNIGISHIENLGSQEGILKAKMEITDYFTNENTLIINGEDSFLTSIKDKDYKIVSCGLNEKANLKATEVNLMEESIEFILNKDDEKHKFNIDAPGEHSVLNSLLAIGCGVELGVSYDDISEGLKNLARTPMRLEIIRNKEGYVIINDCYNASPQSMKSALEVQNNIKCDKRIAVLGTMLELGDESYLAHKEIGEYAKEIKVDELLVTGDFSKAYKEGFGEDTKVFNTKLELIEYLKANVSIGNSILVKASRSMKFEEIVDAVK